MSINLNPLPPNILHIFDNEPITSRRNPMYPVGQNGEERSFADILTESLNTAGVKDFIDKGSTMELMMGEADDLSGIMIDAQKAELALQFALQIRNKVIDAYNEVMRMSV